MLHGEQIPAAIALFFRCAGGRRAADACGPPSARLPHHAGRVAASQPVVLVFATVAIILSGAGDTPGQRIRPSLNEGSFAIRRCAFPGTVCRRRSNAAATGDRIGSVDQIRSGWYCWLLKPQSQWRRRGNPGQYWPPCRKPWVVCRTPYNFSARKASEVDLRRAQRPWQSRSSATTWSS